MWLLRKINDEGTIRYLISEKKCFTVGRQNCDIDLSDSSISRTHCVINVAPKKDCPFAVQTSYGVWVVDKKSKYGTFILKNHEWVRIEQEKVEELSNGTVIRFGLVDNIWRLEYKPLIACTSKLSKEEIQELKSLLTSVDGRLISKWGKLCTVVFVNDLTITVKVLLALINGIPIVTINYLRQLIDNVKQNLAWPNYKHFKPEIAESTLIPHLVSLNTEDHRKELFKGKIFVIPTEEQLENLKEIILAAGGQAELLELDGNWRRLTEENFIIVQLPYALLITPDKRANSFKNLANVLKNEYQVRVVPEIEIFQAIAYSSIEKYCNPKSLSFQIRQSVHNQYSCGDIIEEATPSQSDTQKEPELNVIRSEQSTSLNQMTPRKRTHSPEQQESKKKIILDDGRDADFDIFQGDEDLDVLMRENSDKRLNEGSNEDDVLKDLQNTGRSKEPSRISTSTLVNNDRKEKFMLSSDNESLDFWNDSENKQTKTKPQKRKISETSNKSDLYPFGKKLCNLEQTEKIVSVTNDINIKASSSSIINRKNTSSDKSKNRKLTEFVDNSDGRWIRRKNANCSRSISEKDCDELEWLNKNTKMFKKKETFKHEPIVNYSEKSLEEIGNTLKREGWHQSRSAWMRIRTAS